MKAGNKYILQYLRVAEDLLQEEESDDDYIEKPSEGWTACSMGDIDGEADVGELELYADGPVEFHGGIFDEEDYVAAPEGEVSIMEWT